MIKLAEESVNKTSQNCPWAYQKMNLNLMNNFGQAIQLLNTLATNEKAQIYDMFNKEKQKQLKAEIE